MLYIYYGEDEGSSRKAFRERIDKLVQEGYEQIILQPEELKEKLQNSQLSGLFNSKLVYTSENCLLDEQIVKILKNYQNDKKIVIVLWENQKDPRSIKKLYSKNCLFESKYSASIFTFLDSVYPKNLKTVYKQLEIIRQSNETNIIHYKLTKRMLEILFILNNKPLNGYEQWMLWKLKKQASLWQKERAEKFFKTLVRVERQEKTGTSPLNLSQALDIAICFHLS